MDRGMVDHKLICSSAPLSEDDRQRVLRFFAFYARAKGLLNLLRGQSGRNACDGWIDVEQALAQAAPRAASWRGPQVHF